MNWVITQDGGGVNLALVPYLWIEEGTGRDYNGIAILKASESGWRESEDGERTFPMMHEICVVLGDYDEAKPLIPALLKMAANQPLVDIAEVVQSLGLELGHHMDHHP